ncbi:septal ring lytic transglycosylase RlpA family protein [Flexithrix dorotheae]|uniref:septal ring lytic transglycosylase RlpA family protein n=1 Tax=Flexithrix dorotheae TaxID=70993 RepID=UPI0003767437|nr:septal ring lytic transglycosylase RlpA family protein [Flexithrix dorotheae]
MKVKLLYLFSILLCLSQAGFSQKYKIGYKQKGKASYYAGKYHGRKTASGEKYNMNAMTAAHKKLPFNTMVKVTNKANGKSVTLRITDRGPYKGGRIIDVSKEAAKRLDMIKSGVTTVELEIIGFNGKPEATKKSKKKKKKKSKKKKNKEASVSKIPAKTIPVAGGNGPEFELNKTYTTAGKLYNPKGYGIQLASYADLNQAVKTAKGAQKKGLTKVFIQPGLVKNRTYYRIFYGESANQNSIKKELGKVKRSGFPKAFVKAYN